MTLHEALLRVRKMDKAGARYGICHYVNKFRDTKGREVMKLATEWPEFSGELLYPVPHPDFDCPEEAFSRVPDYEMWCPNHPYGAARLRLLDWLIEQTREV